MPQVVQLIQRVTTPTVQTSLGRPPSIGADVLVLFASATMGPGDQAAIRSYLAGGGRLLLVGTAPNKLATGDTSNDDVSSIGSWFAGATVARRFDSFDIHGVSGSPGFPFGATLYGRELFLAGVVVSPVAVSATRLTTADLGAIAGFTYNPPIGGHLAFLGGLGLGSTEDDVASQGVFLAECRWLADGS